MENGKYNIHLTDYSFQKMCNDEFGINRGVYNEIDKWFYNKGLVDILKRRKAILNFILLNERNEKNKVRFGNGGLRDKLVEYFDQVAM
jgi:riboflavin kinase